jgi:hypothetical protein
MNIVFVICIDGGEKRCEEILNLLERTRLRVGGARWMMLGCKY